MTEPWSTDLLRQHRKLLAAIRGPSALGFDEQRALADLAERHGVLGLLAQAWRDARIDVDPGLDRELRLRDLAREIDHAAHLDWLGKIDVGLASAGIRGVALKGALLARRLYAQPSARATSDIDILVAERDLARAAEVLTGLGYVGRSGADEARFRREHHHLHFDHPDAAMVELHFHGFTAFGRVLPSAELVARAVTAPVPLDALGVLARVDELVFLAVHAAAHRFIRLAWILDLIKLAAMMPAAAIAFARECAATHGFNEAFGAAGRIAVAVDAATELAPEQRDVFATASRRSRAALALIGEPSQAPLRVGSRLVYTILLADSVPAALRFAWRAAKQRLPQRP